MWGRKTKRIAELEAELVHTRENLGIARVLAGHPGLMQDIPVEKGVWYNVSYMFRHDGSPSLNIADLLVEQSPGGGWKRAAWDFFDGAGDGS